MSSVPVVLSSWLILTRTRCDLPRHMRLQAVEKPQSNNGGVGRDKPSHLRPTEGGTLPEMTRFGEVVELEAVASVVGGGAERGAGATSLESRAESFPQGDLQAGLRGVCVGVEGGAVGLHDSIIGRQRM